MPAFTLLSGGGAGVPGAWTSALKKGVFSTGRRTISQSELDGLAVTVDGQVFFGLAERVATKTKLDEVSGEITGFALKDGAGNALAVDLLKRTIKMTLKSAPGIDPTDGHVGMRVDSPDFSAALRSRAVVTGTKVVCRSATGEVFLP